MEKKNRSGSTFLPNLKIQILLIHLNLIHIDILIKIEMNLNNNYKSRYDLIIVTLKFVKEESNIN